MSLRRVVRLVPSADVARLQDLLERCSDYFELHEGWPTPPDAAEYEFTCTAPEFTVDDLHPLAFEGEDGALQAMAQLVRNYPKPQTWWISLFVVTPELRSCGVGAELLQCVFDTARADGATEIQLAVSVNNPRGARFWDAAGFRDMGRSGPVTARNGHVDTVRMLVARLRDPATS